MPQKTSPKKNASPKPYPEGGEKDGPPNRVAESVAIHYGKRPATPGKVPRTSVRQIAGYAVSTEVWQFAVANDLLPHLETAVRLVRACFPTARKIDFEYVVDPEIENWSWITIAIKVSGTVEGVLVQMNCFDDEMIRQVPIEKGAKICLRVGGL
jgi:hypothetical protein